MFPESPLPDRSAAILPDISAVSKLQYAAGAVDSGGVVAPVIVKVIAFDTPALGGPLTVIATVPGAATRLAGIGMRNSVELTKIDGENSGFPTGVPFQYTQVPASGSRLQLEQCSKKFVPRTVRVKPALPAATDVGLMLEMVAGT